MKEILNNHLLIASHNQGKLREIRELLAPFKMEIGSAAEHDVPEPEETETSFEGNALLKARHCFEHTKIASLADDSGLVVPDLDGAPGIYSARWAGPKKDFAMAMERIREELAEKFPGRDVEAQPHAAYFVCSLALVGEGVEEVFTGTVHGTLRFPPRGEKGFGYDPIFVPEGMSESFAEIDPAKKQAMSHRAHAFEQLVAWLG